MIAYLTADSTIIFAITSCWQSLLISWSGLCLKFWLNGWFGSWLMWFGLFRKNFGLRAAVCLRGVRGSHCIFVMFLSRVICSSGYDGGWMVGMLVDWGGFVYSEITFVRERWFAIVVCALGLVAWERVVVVLFLWRCLEPFWERSHRKRGTHCSWSNGLYHSYVISLEFALYIYGCSRIVDI